MGAATSLALMAGGAGMATGGAYYGALSRQSSLQFSADMAEISARLSEKSAESALDQGQRQVGALTLRAGQLKSSQRTAMAANGVDLGSGSAAEVQASTDVMKEIDANTLTANAVRTAWGYRTQATNFRNEALIKRAEADSISPAGAAMSTLLTTGGFVADRWYQFGKAGALGTATQYGTTVGSQQTRMLAEQDAGFWNRN